MTPHHLQLLLSKEQIAHRVREIARQVHADYQGKDLVILMVLKGAICLVADLIREIDLPLGIEWIKCSSYGASGKRRRELEIFGQEQLDVKNRDVLIVDDIFDTGHTIAALREILHERGARSIQSLVLLLKNVPHITTHLPEYVLFEIEDRFVVGYGLDFKEQYRGLPGIYTERE